MSYSELITTRSLTGDAGGTIALMSVKDCAKASIQLRSPDWGGAVLAPVASNDGLQWDLLDYPETLNANGMFQDIDVYCFAYLGVRLVTAAYPVLSQTVSIGMYAYAETPT